MTKTLILIRHAKSSWDAPDLSDHERPLNTRGQRAAPRIGAWLASQGAVPGEVICSTATRTRETWAAIAPYLESAPEPRFEEALYLASPRKMLDLLQGAEADVVAMVAHNPGTASLAWSLVETPPAHERFGHFPTAATVVMRFDVDTWGKVGPGMGQVDAFAVPRELPDP